MNKRYGKKRSPDCECTDRSTCRACLRDAGPTTRRYPERTPTHEHDCTSCTYLGQTIGRGKLVDLYQCGNTILARYGNEPEDYASTSYGMAHPEGHAELFAAQALATEPKARS